MASIYGKGQEKKTGSEDEKGITEIRGGKKNVWVTIDGISLGFDTGYFASVIRETPEYKEALGMKVALINRP